MVWFSDWITPNVALDAGDIDLNFFQSAPCLKNANGQAGQDLVMAPGILANPGPYSLKHQSFDEIPQNGTVAISSDPVKQGRALFADRKAGLITRRDGVGFLGSIDDIVANPKNLSFTEVEGPQLVRVTEMLTSPRGYPHFIVTAGAIDPTSALWYSGIEDPRIQSLIKLYQNSKAVEDQARKSFASSDKLYIFAWKAV